MYYIHVTLYTIKLNSNWPGQLRNCWLLDERNDESCWRCTYIGGQHCCKACRKREISISTICDKPIPVAGTNLWDSPQTSRCDMRRPPLRYILHETIACRHCCDKNLSSAAIGT
jgi:hypothetical protein